MPRSAPLHADELIALVTASDWLMDELRAVRALRLGSWCIGAGAVRNLVWDALAGKAERSALSDIDVAYFDLSDVSTESDKRLQQQLETAMTDVPWEVTNQAGVHLWFERYFGHAVAPVNSLAEAVATWPEFATSVGVFLTDEDKVEIIAPLGLDDLFTMTVRHNPARASVANYQARVAQKSIANNGPASPLSRQRAKTLGNRLHDCFDT